MPSLSLAVASSLRSPSFPVLNPRSISSPRLLKQHASPPLPILRYPILHRFPSRSVLRILDRREIVVRAAEDGGGEPSEIAAADAAKEALAAEEARGQSTMPERFRYLTKEAPERPVRWPWVMALVFLVYCWRTVLWELSNWKKAALSILNFLGYLSKLALAFVFHFIGSPITGLIRCIEYSLYVVRYIYSGIVAFAPVPEQSCSHPQYWPLLKQLSQTLLTANPIFSLWLELLGSPLSRALFLNCSSGYFSLECSVTRSS